MKHEKFSQKLYDMLRNKIKEKRKELKIQQNELAKEMGIAPTTYSSFEAGRHNFSFTQLVDLVMRLEIKITDILPQENMLEQKQEEVLLSLGDASDIITILKQGLLDSNTVKEEVRELKEKISNMESMMAEFLTVAKANLPKTKKK